VVNKGADGEVTIFVPLILSQLVHGETVLEEFENGCYIQVKDYHLARVERGFKSPSERISPLEQRIVLLEERLSKLEEYVKNLQTKDIIFMSKS